MYFIAILFVAINTSYLPGIYHSIFHLNFMVAYMYIVVL